MDSMRKQNDEGRKVKLSKYNEYYCEHKFREPSSKIHYYLYLFGIFLF